MNKKEIVELLEELAIGVQGKRDGYEDKLKNLGNEHKLYHYFRESLQHTEGQLYEINYILETITRK